MVFPINEFEQYIDGTILERGLSYFEGGLIEEPQHSGGAYHFKVNGTEPYEVYLKLKKHTVIEHSCTCPFDYGPVCKHEAAALFYLQQEPLKIEVKKKKPKKKRKTLDDKVDDLLKELDQEELAGFIKQLTVEDTSLRRRLLASFAHLIEKQSITLYSKQIKAIISGAKRGGYVDYYGARKLGNAVFMIGQQAQDHLEAGNMETAYYMGFAILNEMVKALGFVDDSNGDIGINIDLAENLLGHLSQREDIEEDLRKIFYRECLKAFEEKRFGGWDWHLSPLYWASSLSRSDAEARHVLNILKEQNFGDYHKDEAQAIQFNLITQLDGHEKAQEFLLDNLDNQQFRRLYLNLLIEAGNFEKAKQVAHEGIKQDLKIGYTGLVNDWKEYLLQIAQKEEDVENVIKYARELLTSVNRDWMQYYRILKSCFAETDWETYLNDFIKNLKVNWNTMDLMTGIYVEESRWEELFKLLTKYSGIEYLRHYEKYLLPTYSNEIALFYEAQTERYLEANVGRSHYRKAAKYIRWIKKLGELQIAHDLVKRMVQKYSNRPALLEEFEKI